MTEAKHTPGKLRTYTYETAHGKVSAIATNNGDYYEIARIFGRRHEQDASRIVHTWNCHDELVAALKRAHQYVLLAYLDCKDAGKDGLAEIAKNDLEMVRSALDCDREND